MRRSLIGALRHGAALASWNKQSDGKFHLALSRLFQMTFSLMLKGIDFFPICIAPQVSRVS